MHTVVRKLAHVTEFAILGILWSFALLRDAAGEKHTTWCLRCCAGFAGIAAAAIDESIQKFVPGRSGEIKDVCIDGAGIVLGICLQWLISCVIKEIREKRSNKN